MSGFFEKKPATALDGLVSAVYGDGPHRKTANVAVAARIAAEELLNRKFDTSVILAAAVELDRGPLPYSTHDLAVSVALGFLKNPEQKERLRDVQATARILVEKWSLEGKVVGPLARSFEAVLASRFDVDQSDGDHPKENPDLREFEDEVVEAVKPLPEMVDLNNDGAGRRIDQKCGELLLIVSLVAIAGIALFSKCGPYTSVCRKMTFLEAIANGLYKLWFLGEVESRIPLFLCLLVLAYGFMLIRGTLSLPGQFRRHIAKVVK